MNRKVITLATLIGLLGMSQSILQIRKELRSQAMSLRHNYHDSTSGDLLNQTNPKIIPVNLAYSENPYIYTADFYLGSNSQKTKMRFSTDTDWTIVASADCQNCQSKSYDKKTSSSSKPGVIKST